jgi:hypothetical protein
LFFLILFSKQQPTCQELIMPRIHTLALSLALAMIAPLASTQSHAVQRTHVSAAFGNDANTATNCSAAAPCRFFAAAMTVTDNNGEVIVLDSGGYGAVTITKSVALIAPTGVYAGISVFGGRGVTINAAGAKVTLRGLTINNQGSGGTGIYMSGGASLSVEDCVITNFSSPAEYGIHVVTAAAVRVLGTLLRDNSEAIRLEGGPTADISRTVIVGSGTYGILANGNASGTTTSAVVTDTIISGGNFAIWSVASGANANAHVAVIRSTISNANIGAASSNYSGAGTALLTISESLVTRNNVGLRRDQASTSSATLRSFGNNTLDQNLNDTVGIITAVTLR